MSRAIADFSPREAWAPLPPRRWNAANIRHFYRRAGWNATPAQVEEALRDGMQRTISRHFGRPLSMPEPASLIDAHERREEYASQLRQVSGPDERRMLQRDFRRRTQADYEDLSIRWLQFAANPQHGPYEKWVSFLQNIFVVSFDQVRNPKFHYDHQELLRENGLGSYPDLCKAVLRSPAMILYLNLQESRASAPNENFARELFELFILGEGNYTEEDVREAARAFTGYRQRNGEFVFRRQDHDRTQKRVFGRRGQWDGNNVIDLAFRQPSAATFLLTEMCRYYLSEHPFPQAHIDELGRLWRENNFDLRFLTQLFFSSTAFYHPSCRGGLIKSPLQFHLGLMYDLQLTVPPLPRSVLSAYRLMGQPLYNPPNVRGWVGGRLWINASTLSARHRLVESLFGSFNEERLNADERAALRSAEREGPVQPVVSRERLDQMADLEPHQVADRFIQYFLPGPPSEAFREKVIAALSVPRRQRPNAIRTVATAILQSPGYNLC